MTCPKSCSSATATTWTELGWEVGGRGGLIVRQLLTGPPSSPGKVETPETFSRWVRTGLHKLPFLTDFGQASVYVIFFIRTKGSFATLLTWTSSQQGGLCLVRLFTRWPKQSRNCQTLQVGQPETDLFNFCYLSITFAMYWSKQTTNQPRFKGKKVTNIHRIYLW